MRYHALRARTNQWLWRDVPLTAVTRTDVLNGGGTIQATVPSDLTNVVASDGKRLFDDWSTIILCEDDTGRIVRHGIMQPQTSYEAQSGTINCAGVAAFPKGYIYMTQRLWGPSSSAPVLPRPDPLSIFWDLWAYIQSQAMSNLGVVLSGPKKSGQFIGDNEEPYRLRWFEVPDLGDEIDKLAAATPFDFVETAKWTNTDRTAVQLGITVGYPRIGKTRTDLRFALGENIIEQPTIVTPENYANFILGLGNGEGSTLVYKTAAKDDGRLRRFKVLTDKTATSTQIATRTNLYLERLSSGKIDVASVTIRDHPNARLSDVNIGDDIRLQFTSPTYGPVDLNVRVLTITRTDDEETAVLGTQMSSSFLYSATEELS